MKNLTSSAKIFVETYLTKEAYIVFQVQEILMFHFRRKRNGLDADGLQGIKY